MSQRHVIAASWRLGKERWELSSTLEAGTHLGVCQVTAPCTREHAPANAKPIGAIRLDSVLV